jgi:hypothetical protein
MPPVAVGRNPAAIIHDVTPITDGHELNLGKDLRPSPRRPTRKGRYRYRQIESFAPALAAQAVAEATSAPLPATLLFGLRDQVTHDDPTSISLLQNTKVVDVPIRHHLAGGRLLPDSNQLASDESHFGC